MKLAASVALIVLLGAGCASSSRSDAPEKSLATRGFEEASRQLAEGVASQHFRGWAPHVTLTGEPPRPHLRLGTIRNESRSKLDLTAFRRELTRRLVEGGKVFVAPDRGATDAAEPAHDADGDADALDEGGVAAERPEPRISFLVTGSVHDDLHDEDGERIHTLIFDLRLIDLRTMNVVHQVHAASRDVLQD